MQRYKMNKIKKFSLNKFLLAGDKFLSEMHFLKVIGDLLLKTKKEDKGTK